MSYCRRCATGECAQHYQMTPQPMMRLMLDEGTPERRQDDAMVHICCEDMETAIQAGVLAVNPHRGTLYIRGPQSYWSVSYCPFCRRSADKVQRGTRGAP
jgi:hypothetical protein